MQYELRKVEIGKFFNMTNTGKVQQGNTIYNLEKEIISEIICIIDYQKGVAVDINDFTKTYKLLKRNKYNQILPNQDITEDQLYALKLKELTQDDLGILKEIKYNIKINKYSNQQRVK